MLPDGRSYELANGNEGIYGMLMTGLGKPNRRSAPLLFLSVLS